MVLMSMMYGTRITWFRDNCGNDGRAAQRGVLLLLKRPGGVIRGHPLAADLRAYGLVHPPRAEQARYLQIQLFRVGQVSDLAERLAPTRGGDDERAVAEQPAQDCALNSLDGVESGLIVTWAA
jgi:hypothetical protein